MKAVGGIMNLQSLIDWWEVAGDMVCRRLERYNIIQHGWGE